MAWKIEFEKHAAKELKKFDSKVIERILGSLSRLEKLDDPRSLGEVLKGSVLGSFWKYRIGNYRIICKIQDSTLLILVVKIGHRREVYR